jgi:hypothetical protein
MRIRRSARSCAPRHISSLDVLTTTSASTTSWPEAEMTKGAMYSTPRSKHALSVATIERQTAAVAIVVKGLVTRILLGLETLIDCFS